MQRGLRNADHSSLASSSISALVLLFLPVAWELHPASAFTDGTLEGPEFRVGKESAGNLHTSNSIVLSAKQTGP